MRLWPFGAEHRLSIDDVLRGAYVDAAGGSGVPPVIEALGAVETAAGLWSRSLSAATVTPANAITSSLTPTVLASIGRALATRGECLFVLDVDDAGLTLTQASSWTVAGGMHPESLDATAVELPIPGDRVVKRTLAASAGAAPEIRYAAVGALERVVSAGVGPGYGSPGRMVGETS